MKCQALLISALILALAFGGSATLAFETDQYNLPPEPLADVGDEFSIYVRDRIMMAIFKLNAEIAEHEACIQKTVAATKKCGSPESELKKLRELNSPDTVAEAVYEELGHGNIFTSITGKWLNSHKFEHEPARYKTSYADSIFLTNPLDYATISPTMRIYGSEFGTDKIDHFFQQGYKYYQMYRKAVEKGATREDAIRKAVNWGKKTERLFFGMLISGVYSNADLYANYAGLRFFQSLTEPVDLADGTRLYQLLMIRDGMRWSFYDDKKDAAIRPFISDHLNEALNPSGFSFLRFPTVKRVVKKQACPEWRTLYPTATAADFEKRSKDLEIWHGEDYGYTKKSKTVRISSCFETPTDASTNAREVP